MTESLQAQIRKEAKQLFTIETPPLEFNSQEEHAQYELAYDIQMQRRQAYIQGASKWAEKLEKIREELIQRCNRWYGQPSTSHAQAGRYAEANDILSIIDKYLKE